jgi:hypothetical protein
VRCARGSRLEETFLCLSCIADPATRIEVAASLDQPEPRAYVVKEFHWVGGWRIGGEEESRERHARA